MNLHEVPKAVVNSICQFPDEYKNRILKMALLSYQPTAQNRSKTIENFSNESGISKEQTYEILGVFIALIRFFLETNSNEFNTRLLEIGFTSDFVEKLPFISNREEIISNLLSSYSTEFAKLSSLTWKIDISVGDSTLVKKIPANVVLCLTLKNGNKYTIEIDTKTFHKLRFNVALLLKELNSFNFLSK